MKRLYAIILGVCAAAFVLAARAQVSSNTNNTIVRFNIMNQATNYGSIDIELFDEDKPETVRNFLLYVYSGAYSNLVVQRIETNFVMQAGSRRVANPKSTNDFNTYIAGSNFGTVTNEFSMGPRLTNLFGTVAMARQDGQTNSATSDFFFNLKDNPGLDDQYGGFTVFGRVINTEGPNTGTNLLNTFRSFPNITRVCFDIFQFFDCLDQLPISTNRLVYTTNSDSTITTNQRLPQVQDLFVMQPTILRGRPRDRVAPKLALASPSTKLRLTTNNSVTFTGKASDNEAVARVLYDSGNVVNVASGTTNWTQVLTLNPGTNKILFKTIDWFGNESKPIRRTIFYQVPTEITLSNSGAGVIVGATNKQKLDIGRGYALVAKPARGNFFVGWRGTAGDWPLSRFAFLMQQGTSISAVFATNPFPRLRGSYWGVITPRATNSGPHVAGTISFTLGTRGLYAGRLQLLGVSYPIRGAFNLANSSVIAGKRANSPLTLNLVISTNGPAEIHGDYADGSEVGSVQMYRLESSDAAAPQAGDYTFAVAPQAGSALGEGFGIGTATVSGAGAITWSGTTQDAIDFAQSTAIYSGGHFPLFVKRSSQEALIGWMKFSTNNTEFEGDARWISPVFEHPFGETLHVNGSRFNAPTPGAPYLSWTNGSVMLAGDDLGPPIEVPVSLEGGLISLDPNAVNLQLVPAANGRISGSLVRPGTQNPTPVQAVFLQNSNLAAGFFVGTNRSGSVRMRANQ